MELYPNFFGASRYSIRMSYVCLNYEKCAENSAVDGMLILHICYPLVVGSFYIFVFHIRYRFVGHFSLELGSVAQTKMCIHNTRRKRLRYRESAKFILPDRNVNKTKETYNYNCCHLSVWSVMVLCVCACLHCALFFFSPSVCRFWRVQNVQCGCDSGKRHPNLNNNNNKRWQTRHNSKMKFQNAYKREISSFRLPNKQKKFDKFDSPHITVSNNRMKEEPKPNENEQRRINVCTR